MSEESRFLNFQNFLHISKEKEEGVDTYLSRARTLYNKTQSGIVKLEGGQVSPYAVSEYLYIAVVVKGLPNHLRNEVNKRLKVTGTVTIAELESLLGNIQLEKNSNRKRESSIEISIAQKKKNKKFSKKTDGKATVTCTHCKKMGTLKINAGLNIQTNVQNKNHKYFAYRRITNTLVIFPQIQVTNIPFNTKTVDVYEITLRKNRQ